MPTLSEQLADPVSAPIHDALVAGVDVLGQDETVDFVPYVRVVLPADGFVFWLNANLLTPVQLSAHGLQTAVPVTVAGSLHYATIGHMVEDEVISIRRVDFTAETQITALAEIAPDVMYVATWETPLGSFRFSFSQRSSYYFQANIHHYVGDAIYPAFVSQLIDTIDGFDQRQVVSNSMPIWLAMMGAYPYPSLFTVRFPVYPAFLIPANLTPPYLAVDINPGSTRALQSFPSLDRYGTHSQLVAERVRLIMYGLRNDEALNLQDALVEYSVNTGFFGFMGMPVVRDERRPQIELAALAQRKSLELDISYQQGTMRNLSRRLISSALLGNIYPSDDPILPTGNANIVPPPG